MTTDARDGVPDLLVAEDDPDDLFLLRKALTSVAPTLRVGIARDGVALLELLDTFDRGALPRLLILDLNLPRCDGREVLTECRKRRLAVPIVVLTTSTESSDVERCLALGAVQVLAKPDPFPQLRAVVGGLIERYVAHPERDPVR